MAGLNVLGREGAFASLPSHFWDVLFDHCAPARVGSPFRVTTVIHKIIGQRIRNFVANGNMLVLTGRIL